MPRYKTILFTLTILAILGGAFIINPSTAKAQAVCTDSDNGDFPYTVGTVTGRFGSQSYFSTWTDFCSDASDPQNWKTVSSCNGPDCYQREHVCNNNSNASRLSFNCPNGCKDGVCLSLSKVEAVSTKSTAYEKISNSLASISMMISRLIEAFKQDILGR